MSFRQLRRFFVLFLFIYLFSAVLVFADDIFVETTLSDSGTDYSVSVAGSFPVSDVTPLNEWRIYSSNLDKSTGGANFSDKYVVASYSLTLKNGSTVMNPGDYGEQVMVTITSDVFDGLTNFHVYRVNGMTAQEQYIADINPDDNSISFNATYLSTVVITADSPASVTVNCYDGSVKTFVLSDADRIMIPDPSIVYYSTIPDAYYFETDDFLIFMAHDGMDYTHLSPDIYEGTVCVYSGSHSGDFTFDGLNVENAVYCGLGIHEYPYGDIIVSYENTYFMDCYFAEGSSTCYDVSIDNNIKNVDFYGYDWKANEGKIVSVYISGDSLTYLNLSSWDNTLRPSQAICMYTNNANTFSNLNHIVLPSYTTTMTASGNLTPVLTFPHVMYDWNNNNKAYTSWNPNTAVLGDGAIVFDLRNTRSGVTPLYTHPVTGKVYYAEPYDADTEPGGYTNVFDWSLEQDGSLLAYFYAADNLLVLTGEGNSMMPDNTYSFWQTSATSGVTSMVFVDCKPHGSMQNLANYNRTITYFDTAGLDTSEVTNMEYMFAYATVSSVDCSGFDFSKVNTVSHMFYYASGTPTGLAGKDFSNVKNCSQMFCYLNTASSVSQSLIDSSDLDLSNTDFSGLVTGDVEMFYNVKMNSLNMDGMILGNKNDIGYYNTNFIYNSTIKNISMNDFTWGLGKIYVMFSSVVSDKLSMNNFYAPNVVSVNDMFTNNNEIPLLEIENLSMPAVTSISRVIGGGKFVDTDLDMSSWSFPSVETIDGLLSTGLTVVFKSITAKNMVFPKLKSLKYFVAYVHTLSLHIEDISMPVLSRMESYFINMYCGVSGQNYDDKWTIKNISMPKCSSISGCNDLIYLYTGYASSMGGYPSSYALIDIDASGWDLSGLSNIAYYSSFYFLYAPYTLRLYANDWKIGTSPVDANGNPVSSVSYNCDLYFFTCDSTIYFEANDWELGSFLSGGHTINMYSMSPKKCAYFYANRWKIKGLMNAELFISNIGQPGNYASVVQADDWTFTDYAGAFAPTHSGSTAHIRNWFNSVYAGSFSADGWTFNGYAGLYQFFRDLHCGSFSADNWTFENQAYITESFSLSASDNYFRDFSIEGWQTKEEFSFYKLFNATGFDSITIKDCSFSVGKPVDMGYMFYGISTGDLIFDNVKFGNVSQYQGTTVMCYDCTFDSISMDGTEFGTFSISNPTSQGMFWKGSITESADISDIVVHNEGPFVSVFLAVALPEKVCLDNWTFEKGAIYDSGNPMYPVFGSSSGVKEIELTDWDFGGDLDINMIIYNCADLEKFTMADVDITGKLTFRSHMYGNGSLITNAQKLSDIDLDGWHIVGDTDMSSAGYGLINNVANTDGKISMKDWVFDGYVTLPLYIFRSSNFSELDISGWEFNGGGKWRGALLYYCYNLKEFDISTWDFSNLECTPDTNMNVLLYNTGSYIDVPDTLKLPCYSVGTGGTEWARYLHQVSGMMTYYDWDDNNVSYQQWSNVEPMNTRAMTLHTVPFSVSTNADNLVLAIGSDGNVSVDETEGFTYGWQYSIDGGTIWFDISDGIVSGTSFGDSDTAVLTINAASDVLGGGNPYLIRARVSSPLGCDYYSGNVNVSYDDTFLPSFDDMSGPVTLIKNMDSSVSVTGNNLVTCKWQYSLNGLDWFDLADGLKKGTRFSGCGTDEVTINATTDDFSSGDSYQIRCLGYNAHGNQAVSDSVTISYGASFYGAYIESMEVSVTGTIRSDLLDFKNTDNGISIMLTYSNGVQEPCDSSLIRFVDDPSVGSFAALEAKVNTVVDTAEVTVNDNGTYTWDGKKVSKWTDDAKNVSYHYAGYTKAALKACLYDTVSINKGTNHIYAILPDYEDVTHSVLDVITITGIDSTKPAIKYRKQIWVSDGVAHEKGVLRDEGEALDLIICAEDNDTDVRSLVYSWTKDGDPVDIITAAGVYQSGFDEDESGKTYHFLRLDGSSDALNGTYICTVIDGAGNSSVSGAFDVEAWDTTLPLVEVEIDPPEGTLSAKKELIVTVEDEHPAVRPFWFGREPIGTDDDGNPVINEAEWMSEEPVIMDPGTYYFYVRDVMNNITQYDGGGEDGGIVITEDDLDRNAPVIDDVVLSAGEPYEGGRYTVLTVTAHDEGPVYYVLLNASGIPCGSDDYEDGHISDGKFDKITESGTYTVMAYDDASNRSTVSVDIDADFYAGRKEFGPDDTDEAFDPSVKISPLTWTNKAVTVELSLGDTDLEPLVSFDKGRSYRSVADNSASEVVIECGSYQIWIKDKYGNIYKSDDFKISNIDKEEPSVSAFLNKDGGITAIVTDPFSVSGSNASGLNTVSYIYKDTEGNESNEVMLGTFGEGVYSNSYNIIDLRLGYYRFYVKDNAGNEAGNGNGITFDFSDPVPDNDLFYGTDEEIAARLALNVKHSPSGWTKVSVTLTFDPDDETGIDMDSIMWDGCVKKRSITVYENSEHSFTIKDIYGHEYKSGPVVVDNIDRELPVIEAELTGNSLDIVASDGLSGVDKIILQRKGTVFESLMSVDGFLWRDGTDIDDRIVLENNKGDSGVKGSSMAWNIDLEKKGIYTAYAYDVAGNISVSEVRFKVKEPSVGKGEAEKEPGIEKSPDTSGEKPSDGNGEADKDEDDDGRCGSKDDNYNYGSYGSGYNAGSVLLTPSTFELLQSYGSAYYQFDGDGNGSIVNGSAEGSDETASLKDYITGIDSYYGHYILIGILFLIGDAVFLTLYLRKSLPRKSAHK